MHNFGTVVGFEMSRALKKKSFWVMAFLFPVIIAAVFAIAYFSGQASSEAFEKLTQQDFSVAVMDESGLIRPELLKAVDAKVVDHKTATVRDVQHGDLDAFVYYPKDISKQPVEVYGKEVGIFEDSRYSAIASSLLEQSVKQDVPESIRTIVQGDTVVDSTVYRDGQEYDAVKQLILPGLFLVLFYFLIAFFGNQMLTVATEEKENRVVEMLLTTIKARTLIVGKIVALIFLALLQGIIIMLPSIIGYLLLNESASLPDIDVGSLPVDAGAIALGAVIFILSLLMFTGILVFTGAMVPTAKEAGQFFGVVMIAIFGPLYAVTLFVSSPENPLVTFLTLFPLTAPIPLMLRNAIGNLEPWEATAGVAILVLTTILVMMLVVRAFRFGALEYSRRLPLKDLLRK